MIGRVTIELGNRFQRGGARRATSANSRATQSVNDREFGEVEVGKIADLNLLDGSPLEDQMALDRVSRMFHKGVLAKSLALSCATSAAVPIPDGVV